MEKKIIAVFKTHFDFGYTDTAEKVLERYCTEVLQSAIEVCEKSRSLGGHLEYKWTLPAFLLVEMYRRSAGDVRERFETLIRSGQIVCHALPFTMHTSLLSEEMLQNLFLFTDEYCDLFRRPFPIAAKMTDVPGHMSAIIQPLVSRGVRFLHLGKNPASPAPKVPQLFWWEDLKGNRILTLYSRDYGTSVLPPKGWKYPVWLAMLQTGDNVGVQDTEFIKQSAHSVPEGTQFETGTLDDFAREILQCELTSLPVVRGELSDTWIHGAGAYPAAMSVYKRSLRRIRAAEKAAAAKGIDLSELKKNFYKTALLFSEHTFGANVLKFLGKDRRYDKQSLWEDRQTKPGYRLAEKSWKEQEGYAENLRMLSVMAAQMAGSTEEPCGKTLPFEIKTRGNVLDVLFPDGQIISLSYEYIVFGQGDLHRYMKEYLVRFWEWSLSDYGRYGYPSVETGKYVSRIVKTKKTPNGYSAEFMQAPQSIEEYGNFKNVRIDLSYTSQGLRFIFFGGGKEATPMVEAGNLVIDLHRRGKKFAVRQGDQTIDVKRNIINGANHNLWAVNESASIDGTVLHTYDAPLVSFWKNGVCRYWDRPLRSDRAKFVVNLFNNHWGTNFPQWIEGNFSFEFLLEEKGAQRQRAEGI